MHDIIPFIWFIDKAEEAMKFYISIFPRSHIDVIERYQGDLGIPREQELKGKVLNGIFTLNGRQFMCFDGGPQFEMTGAISFYVEFDSQQELDNVWEKLLEGGAPQQCGWLTDKFGITWQIAPSSLGKMMSDPQATPAQKRALMQAMMPMIKLDASELEAAFNGAR